MKRILFTLALLPLYMVMMAQSHVTEVEYQKQSRTAIVNDIPFPAKTIEDAIEDNFSRKGYKGGSAKGFTLYKGVRLHELGSVAYDIYFMVDKKSRKEKDISTVTMMLSTGFDAFVTKSTDEAVILKAKTFLDSLRNMIAAYDLEQQVVTQEAELKKADKKKADLEDEAKDLEKKKRKLEEQISDNEKEQKKHAAELEKQQQILEVLKGKRKS